QRGRSVKPLIRPARPGDREEILRISSQIWEGHDYVPLALDRWLTEGGLFVAELAGRVVGFAKTTILSSSEFWLEGLRVALEYRNRGIGKALAEAQLQEALAQGARSVRYSTGEINRASSRIAQALGFREVARFTFMSGPVQGSEEHPKVIQADEPDKPKLASFIFSSRAYQQSHGLLAHGWIFKELSPALLAELAREGALLYVEARDEIRGVLILLPELYQPDHLAIGFLEGDEQALGELLRFSHRYGQEHGYTELRAMVPADRLVWHLEGHGLAYEPDFRHVLVYEYSRR
ncbi:MAG: GNAT family N-acetyltransferase, partial [Candidatus Bipolaricaulia bacterium]